MFLLSNGYHRVGYSTLSEIEKWVEARKTLGVGWMWWLETPTAIPMPDPWQYCLGQGCQDKEVAWSPGAERASASSCPSSWHVWPYSHHLEWLLDP